MRKFICGAIYYSAADTGEPCEKCGQPVREDKPDESRLCGTTLEVAGRLGRHAIGIELNPDYIHLIDKRVAPWRDQTSLFEVPV
jgi:hypothetical protein